MRGTRRRGAGRPSRHRLSGREASRNLGTGARRSWPRERSDAHETDPCGWSMEGDEIQHRPFHLLVSLLADPSPFDGAAKAHRSIFAGRLARWYFSPKRWSAFGE